MGEWVRDTYTAFCSIFKQRDSDTLAPNTSVQKATTCFLPPSMPVSHQLLMISTVKLSKLRYYSQNFSLLLRHYSRSVLNQLLVKCLYCLLSGYPSARVLRLSQSADLPQRRTADPTPLYVLRCCLTVSAPQILQLLFLFHNLLRLRVSSGFEACSLSFGAWHRE